MLCSFETSISIFGAAALRSSAKAVSTVSFIMRSVSRESSGDFICGLNPNFSRRALSIPFKIEPTLPALSFCG